MDDEIDIEEHDILEHPQVKAVFPDLSKIQIQVHTSGDIFPDETLEKFEELEEKDNNIEDTVADLLETVSSHKQKEGNFEEDVLEDGENSIEKDLEAVVLSDSEGTDTQALLKLNLDITDQNASQDKVSNLEAEHEFIDEDQYFAADKLIDDVQQMPTTNETNRHDPEISDENDNQCRQNEASDPENSENLVENIDEVLNDGHENEDFVHSENCEVDNNVTNGDKTVEANEEHKGINKDAACSDEADYGEDFRKIRIKEEIVFESDNSSDYEEILPDRLSDEPPLDDNNILHYNNKFILGSKPSPKAHSVKFLMVLLEDWSVHLSQSQCYCDDCQTLFATPNALDSHRMSAHSLLAPITNRAFKSTAKSSIIPKNVSKKSTSNKISNSTYCNHCNVSFVDHTSLIKHLYELLPVNKFTCKVCDATFPSQTDLVNHNTIHIKLEVPRNILKPKKTSDNSLLKKILNTEIKPMTSKATKRQYPGEENVSKKVKRSVEIKSEPIDFMWMCKICKDVFDSYGQARKHRTHHPQIMANALMIKKIPIKIPNIKAKLTFEKGKSAKNVADKSFELIQSSALFQCAKCGLHFSSSVAGKSHFTAKQCGIHSNIWSCSICKKNIRRNDRNYHKKQHELSNKIKIYKITKNTYERTLCRCLRCNVHFEYIPLKMHVDQCGKIVSAKCKECNINIPKNKYLEHSQKHDVMKLKRKDFILIDYTVASDKTKTKPEVAKTKNTVDRVPNFSSQPILLGKHVNAIKIEPEKPNIVNKLKFEREKRNVFYCNHCKSVFTRTYTSTNHTTKKCMTRQTSTSICKLCGLRVFKKLLVTHEKLHWKKKLTLNDFVFLDYVTRKPIVPPIPQYPSCEKCQIHFLSNAKIADHICGEDYENCEICGEKFEINALKLHLPLHQLRKPSRQPILPELMMKYESLNAIWNILFLCGKCDLVTDLYDAAVEHSQAHLSKSAQPNTIKCYICSLKFDESCWKKHSELHSRMPINSKHFRILKYSPKELLDESWFRMFASLPEKETRQILDRSVFGAERSLKMMLLKNGLPEFTVYCCNECRVCCNDESILQHASSECARCDHICAECDIAFDSHASLTSHEQLHDKGIKKDEFRIVSFMKKFKNKMKTVKQKPEAKMITEKPAKYVVYKCVECTVCVLVEYSRPFHSCSPKHHVVYCKICKLHFSFRQKTAHRARHMKLRDFVAKNIRIEEFKPIPESKKPRRPDRPQKLTKKTSKGAKQKPKAILSNSKVSERIEEPTTSTKRRSVENFESLVNLTEPKTRKSNRLSGGDAEERTAKLFKCECGLHYTSLRSAQKHMECCDSSNEISKENCSKCGLLFPTDLLVGHLCRHHSRATKLCVEQLRKPETDTKQDAHASDTVKLYKCGECNVYFLNQNSCYKHVYKHEPLDSKQYIECKLCRLQFRILSLHIHMKKHHEEEFLLEKVLVEEYQPKVGNEPPKIDIYFANERFDNVQVSSSND